MESSNESSDANPQPDNTRAGGPDDSRTADTHKEAPTKKPDNPPRGAPEESRSAPR
jgi:hypothetical protein